MCGKVHGMNLPLSTFEIKNSDTRQIAIIIQKFEHCGLTMQ